VKRLLLFIILSSVLTQSGVKTYLLIEWKLYQREITEKYCINKSRPEMQCNGKCYLAKQMRQIEYEYEQSKQPFPPKNIKSAEFLLFYQPLTSAKLFVNAEVSGKSFHGGYYSDSETSDFQKDCFHPPCFLL
jgi:hypothetical protein